MLYFLDEYEEKIIDKYISHGFLCWNAIDYYKIKKNINYTLLETFYSIELNQNKDIYSAHEVSVRLSFSVIERVLLG